jgi:hypothetical protein
MKLLTPKSSTLSPSQSQVWDAVNESIYSVAEISAKSGVSERSIFQWVTGSHEPLEINRTSVINAIKWLNEYGNKKLNALHKHHIFKKVA